MDRHLFWNDVPIDEREQRVYTFRELPEARIHQLLSNGFVLAQDVVSTAANSILPTQSTAEFINSAAFYKSIILLDEELSIVESIYILKFDGYVKIGRTNSIERRYNRSILNSNLIGCSPVSNQFKAEQALLSKFKDRFQIHHGKEFFEYKDENDFEEMKKIFAIVSNEFKCSSNARSSKLIQTFKNSERKIEIWIDIRLSPILIQRFGKNEELRRNTINFCRLISRQIKNGYFDIVHDVEINEDYSFWYFYGYVILERSRTHFVNASRVINSVLRTDCGKRITFMQILEQNNVLRSMLIQLKSEDPSNEYFLYNSKSQPELNGWYIKTDALPTLVAILNPVKALEMNRLILRLGKNSDLLTGGNIDWEVSSLEKRDTDLF